MDRDLEAICHALEEGDDFLVAAHANPDGDAIGSTLALGHVLAALGKKFVLYNETGMPKRFKWLHTPGPILTELPDPMPKWTVILDCGAPERAGKALHQARTAGKTINIDHHIGNPVFGDLNWVDVRQPAVGTMLAEIATRLSVPLTGDLAEAVYLAVATDTGFFTYGNTTPECMELVADLMRRGLDIAAVNPKILDIWTSNRMKLWSVTMAGMKTYYDERMAVVTVTRRMMRRTETTKADCEDLVEFVRKLKTVRAAVFIREEDDDVWKFSLRSSGADNVQAVAARFGGGGHKNAAGGIIEADEDSVRRQLVVAVGRELELE